MVMVRLPPRDFQLKHWVLCVLVGSLAASQFRLSWTAGWRRDVLPRSSLRVQAGARGMDDVDAEWDAYQSAKYGSKVGAERPRRHGPTTTNEKDLVTGIMQELLTGKAPRKAPAEELESEEDRALIPLEDLTVGEFFEGTVVGKMFNNGVYVDIGAGLDGKPFHGILTAEEFRDGFPKGNTWKPGSIVPVRILEITQGQIWLTRRRHGSLARPPRPPEKMPKPSPGALAAMAKVGPEQWLEGEVYSMAIWGVFVAVTPPGETEPVLGMVHMSNFYDGFRNDPDVCVRGGKVRVRVIEVIPEKSKVRLTLKGMSETSSS